MAFESSQGITFSFSGTTYAATSISISESRGEIDTATLNQAYGSTRSFTPSDLVEYTFKVDWIGSRSPETKKTAVLLISSTNTAHGFELRSTAAGGIASTTTSSSLRCTAICTGLSHVVAVGDVVKGSATFKVSKD